MATLFQSSPSPKARSYGDGSDRGGPVELFQSSPSPKARSYHEVRASAGVDGVPILSQPEGQELPVYRSPALR